MIGYLTSKQIEETITDAGRKKYTVKQLRAMVRAEIKNVNKIIADLSKTDKDKYIKDYTKQIGDKYLAMDKSTGEFLTQTKVKYMTSKRLRATYNALQAVQEASTSDAQFAERLQSRKQRALDTWNKNRSSEDQITMEEYDEILDVFNEYDDLVSQYGYNEILDMIKNKSDEEPIWKKIKQAEKEFDDMGLTKTKESILIYIENKDAFIAARNSLIMEKILEEGMTPEDAAATLTFDEINERISGQ